MRGAGRGFRLWVVAAAVSIAGVFAMDLVGQSKTALRVEVSGLRGNRGTVKVSVWNSAHSFLSGPPAGYAEAKVQGSRMTLDVANLPPGSYAVAVYQDENDNGRLDAGVFGIPKEPYGFSGKGKLFGTPSFEDASFVLHEALTVAVKLR